MPYAEVLEAEIKRRIEVGYTQPPPLPDIRRVLQSGFPTTLHIKEESREGLGVHGGRGH